MHRTAAPTRPHARTHVRTYAHTHTHSFSLRLPLSRTRTHTHAHARTRTHIPLRSQALKKLERDLAGQLERCRSGDGLGQKRPSIEAKETYCHWQTCRSGDGFGKEQSRQGSGGSEGVQGADCVRDAGSGQMHTHSATAGARRDRGEVEAEVEIGRASCRERV